MIQHSEKSRCGHVIEMHSPIEFCVQVREVIRRITGENPVPVPLSDCAVAFFVKGLDLEEACSILRMVTQYGEDPAQIARE